MSFDINSFGELFKMSRDAVIGIENNETICFANPAAEMLFSIRVGDTARRYLPEYLLADPAEHYLATVRLDGASYDASVSRRGAHALVCIHRREASPPPTGVGLTRALWEAGNDLLSVRMAADAIITGTSADKDEKLREYAGTLYRSYFRLLRLHNHLTLAESFLLDKKPMTLAVVDLCEFCQTLCGSVNSLIGSMQGEIRFIPPKEPCFVKGDEKLLETMLLNLFANSLLHSQAGSHIDLTLTRQNWRYVLAVDDYGSGIPPARMAELFGMKTDDVPHADAGVGLGLSIVRGIAEYHGGGLVLESREGQGTSLRVILPRPRPEDLCDLHQPKPAYRHNGMIPLLTELSVVLDKSFYTRKFLD